MPWKPAFILPEKSSSPVTELFACRYIQVLVSGRYSEDGSVLVAICNRMQRRKTRYSDFDENEKLYGVPLDGQWHWQTDMKEILAWCELPAADDPRWIPCSTVLPEETEEIYSSGRLKMVSVLALHEIYGNVSTVSLLNRICVEKSGIKYLDEQATDAVLHSSDTEGKAKNIQSKSLLYPASEVKQKDTTILKTHDVSNNSSQYVGLVESDFDDLDDALSAFGDA